MARYVAAVAATVAVLLTAMMEVKAEVRQLKDQMTTLLETMQCAAGGPEDEAEDLPVQLPVQTYEELLQLEEELKDRTLQKRLVSFC